MRHFIKKIENKSMKFIQKKCYDNPQLSFLFAFIGWPIISLAVLSAGCFILILPVGVVLGW